jgi:hypothetical protein
MEDIYEMAVHEIQALTDEIAVLKDALWYSENALRKAEYEIKRLSESLQVCNLERAANYNLYLDEKNARWIANNPNVTLG